VALKYLDDLIKSNVVEIHQQGNSFYYASKKHK